MKKTDLSIERVKGLIDYDPNTGVFTWRPKEAGHKRKSSGYISITIDGCEVKAHQLAWFMTHGEWPSTLVDHINGNTSDNRIENLRDATYKINAQNMRIAKKGTQSRLLGVSWHKRCARWQAVIRIDGKNKYLGLFDTPEEAHAAYLVAKRTHHEGCSI